MKFQQKTTYTPVGEMTVEEVLNKWTDLQHNYYVSMNNGYPRTLHDAYECLADSPRNEVVTIMKAKTKSKWKKGKTTNG